LVLAVGFGAGLAAQLAAFPLPVLAGMLAAAGVLHIALLRDLEGASAWAVAVAVGLVGFQLNLAVGVALGLALWWIPVWALRRRRRRASAGIRFIGEEMG
jgi:hypothetical protein